MAEIVTLDNCAEEPIHIPGAVQPHGVLITVGAEDRLIRHASGNVKEWFNASAESLLGKPLTTILSDEFHADDFREVNPLKSDTAQGPIDVIAHKQGALLVLELERGEKASPSFSNVYRRINVAVERLRTAENVAELARMTAREVKSLSGYQRVMIYRFDEEFNGQVIAEAVENADPFLGLQFPASDIPVQARALYLTNWLRIIPDVDYEASPILSREKAPLDLTHSVLRSVSPMHIQYLKNMGVGASMSVSVIKDGKLWGLIACHHDTAAYLPYEVRQGLEFIGKIFSLQLAAREKNENLEYRQELKNLVPEFVAQMENETDFLQGLLGPKENILRLTRGAGGAAIYYRGNVLLQGDTPPESAVKEIAAWLTERGAEALYATISLGRELPALAKYKDFASGLLAISIPEVEPGFVFWFKPEVIQTVNWSGNPQKTMELTAAGAVLGPRRSFSLWQETVQLKSLPWDAEEIEIAQQLRHAIIEVDLERQVNAALTSNEELDQFAYVIAHDLKEPLRGISNYASFIEDDAGKILDPESLSYLRGIRELSEKSKKLLTELYDFSKLGRTDLSFAEVDLGVVVQDVLGRLANFTAENGLRVLVPRALPTVWCDRVRVAEIFSNLITNAAKYSDRKDRVLEIGYEPERRRFYARDNGIGIDRKDEERIFRMFERLHAPDAYGGGTGCGLPIVKRIVGRHGGAISFDSVMGEGTTFYFTLSPGGESG